jgi:hypothetical protein
MTIAAMSRTPGRQKLRREKSRGRRRQIPGRSCCTSFSAAKSPDIGSAPASLRQRPWMQPLRTLLCGNVPGCSGDASFATKNPVDAGATSRDAAAAQASLRRRPRTSAARPLLYVCVGGCSGCASFSAAMSRGAAAAQASLRRCPQTWAERPLLYACVAQRRRRPWARRPPSSLVVNEHCYSRRGPSDAPSAFLGMGPPQLILPPSLCVILADKEGQNPWEYSAHRRKFAIYAHCERPDPLMADPCALRGHGSLTTEANQGEPPRGWLAWSCLRGCLATPHGPPAVCPAPDGRRLSHLRRGMVVDLIYAKILRRL